MPIGSRHDETGLLMKEERCLLLMCDDGGRWRLDTDPDVAALAGRRVRITGVRTGFDLLAVETVTPC
jgi:hypothetical protein